MELVLLSVLKPNDGSMVMRHVYGNQYFKQNIIKSSKFNEINIFIAIALLFITSISTAGTDGPSGFRNIKELKVGGGVARVTVDSETPFNNPHECGGIGSSTYAALKLDDSTKNSKEIYSAILTAKASNVKINFWFTGCIEIWGESYPLVYAAYL